MFQYPNNPEYMKTGNVSKNNPCSAVQSLTKPLKYYTNLFCKIKTLWKALHLNAITSKAVNRSEKLRQTPQEHSSTPEPPRPEVQKNLWETICCPKIYLHKPISGCHKVVKTERLQLNSHQKQLHWIKNNVWKTSNFMESCLSGCLTKCWSKLFDVVFTWKSL